MNITQRFISTEFGELKVIKTNGELYFPAKICIETLGYKDTTNIIKQHCKGVIKHNLPHPRNPDKTIEMDFIPKMDLFRLIVNSKLLSKERFEDWIVDEIIPFMARAPYATKPNAYINDPKASSQNYIKILKELNIDIVIQNGAPKASSRAIAKKANRSHSSVLRSINRLITEKPELLETSFILNHYKDSQNKEHREYFIDDMGFMFLVLGFTGEKIIDFKIEYIDARNRVQEQQAKLNAITPQKFEI